jgi:predicted ArsR family transcriptional regulator
MKNKTSHKILELCSSINGVRPKDISSLLGITNAAVHRQLRKLEDSGKITKRGTPPKVFYVLAEPQVEYGKSLGLSESEKKIIEEEFCYFLPTGEELTGEKAFSYFLKNTRQDKEPAKRAEEYIKILKEVYRFRKDGIIEGTKRLRQLFLTV